MTDLTSASAPPLGENDHLRGPEAAPLVIVYADFTCGQCAIAALALARAPVRVAYRHLVLTTRNRRALPLAVAAEAAGRQGAFWTFHDLIYRDQSHLDDPHIWQRCTELGLDLGRFEEDRREQALTDRVRRQTREGMRAGAATTPLLVLPDGRLHQGAPDAGLLATL
ncbi:MAG: thioredoxin domain-containing protein [Actinobacteria bacterium]|nr:thioredoxin domain-containing protein [Actinomycetota bacterium]